MTAVTGPPRLTATCVLVDAHDCGPTGVTWAAGCASALGVGLVIQTSPGADPLHDEVSRLRAAHPDLTVHVEHLGRPAARWEGGLVVISRSRAKAAPPLAGKDERDVVVVAGAPAAIAGRFGVVTAVLCPVGADGVLQRAIAFCHARRATRLRLLARHCPGSPVVPDEVADRVHAACPDVIVELVREHRSVQVETRRHPSDLLVVSGRERGPAEGLQPAALAALHHARCPVLFSCT
ncbi:hypothetical protein [Lentzea sp. NPDC003310]|uniref:hypothetical protein n=1 Tax=Lentzea sp. NPDC003310 TaxID=3154447 RepID=UPI0033A22748